MSSIIEENAQFVEKLWTYEGIKCAILGHPRAAHLNGYVQVPKGVELPLDSYEQPILDAHGGITYGLDEEGWIGFDTAHAGDYWPERPDPYGLNDLYATTGFSDATVWTTEKLVAAVEKLAEQVKALRDTPTGSVIQPETRCQECGKGFRLNYEKGEWLAVMRIEWEPRTLKKSETYQFCSWPCLSSWAEAR